MLNRLERSDCHTELLPVLGVFDGSFEGRRCGADGIGRERYGEMVDRAGEPIPSVAGGE